ncbi:MAG TPA: hypothetical protein VMH39_01815 [Gemmatimonadaceae bacterium]|nr:hypothetical protein [Gemmatimonadaceae bacterium]
MPQDYADHHDAELVLRLYELRREPVMRDSRAAIAAKFWPRTFDDIAEVLKADNPLNAPFRQVVSYWEMAYSMARFGVINPEFLVESTGEGINFFARVHPFLDELRALRGPQELRNCDWITTQTEAGKATFARMRDRVAKALATR